MDQPRKIIWDEQEFVAARPGIVGATVHTPQLTAVLYRYEAGSSWEEHSHPQDQITMVLEGTVDFVVDGSPVSLGPGETATLPGGVPHSATVSGSPAVTLNVLTRREVPLPFPDALARRA
jgi:quercetin dioxygenase-like cupin family protein